MSAENTAVNTVSAIHLINHEFHGDRGAVAEAADASIAQVNNWVSQGREFFRLANGDYILKNGLTKIVKIPSRVEGMSTAQLVNHAKDVLRNSGFDDADIVKIFPF